MTARFKHAPHFVSPLWLFILVFATSAYAQSGPTYDTPRETSRRIGPTNAGEMEQFLQPIFQQQMKQLHIPGAVFVFVKNGQVFFKKGYGYADLENEIAVDPDRTLFRVASVSKVLTITAVMQLFEQGLLSLDDDVNRYLKRFKIPATFPQPITVENLLTHTAGFDDIRIGLATLREEDLLPLGEFLARNLPARVMPPRQEYSYSRYGIALAGYLVEVISGLPFEEYVEQNILRPLDMTHSSFLRLESLAQDLAKGYTFRDGEYSPVPYYYFNTGPEAGFSACAGDMAKFMLAHLWRGRYHGVRILADTTARQMHQQNFRHHPKLPGLAYGFYERMENGHRAIQHGGHIPGFVSRILLLPDLDMGFFISCNHDRFKLISTVTEHLFEHYFPVIETDKPVQANEISPEALSRFVGTYRINEYAHNSVEKIFSIRKQFTISTTRDGHLLVKGGQKWQNVAPLLFRNVETGELSAFKAGDRGKISRWFRKRFAFEKLPIYETASFNLSILAVMATVFLSGLSLWPAAGLLRAAGWHDRVKGLTRAARRTAGAVSLLNLLFMIGFGLFFLTFDRMNEFTFGVPRRLILLLCLPLVSCVLTIWMVIYNVKVWKGKMGRAAGRLHYLVLALASIFFLTFLHAWNLLGFRF